MLLKLFISQIQFYYLKFKWELMNCELQVDLFRCKIWKIYVRNDFCFVFFNTSGCKRLKTKRHIFLLTEYVTLDTFTVDFITVNTVLKIYTTFIHIISEFIPSFFSGSSSCCFPFPFVLTFFFLQQNATIPLIIIKPIPSPM